MNVTSPISKLFFLAAVLVFLILAIVTGPMNIAVAKEGSWLALALGFLGLGWLIAPY